MWNIINMRYVFMLIVFSKNRDNPFSLRFNGGAICKTSLWCYGRIRIRMYIFVTCHMIIAVTFQKWKIIIVRVCRTMARKKHCFRGFSFIFGEMDIGLFLIWVFLSPFMFIMPKFLAVIALDIRFSPWYSSLSLVLRRSPLLYCMMVFWFSSALASASLLTTSISSASPSAKIKLCFESLLHRIFYHVQSCFVCEKSSNKLFYS